MSGLRMEDSDLLMSSAITGIGLPSYDAEEGFGDVSGSYGAAGRIVAVWRDCFWIEPNWR